VSTKSYNIPRDIFTGQGGAFSVIWQKKRLFFRRRWQFFGQVEQWIAGSVNLL
jgi:hypothetical protein